MTKSEIGNSLSETDHQQLLHQLEAVRASLALDLGESIALLASVATDLVLRTESEESPLHSSKFVELFTCIHTTAELFLLLGGFDALAAELEVPLKHLLVVLEKSRDDFDREATTISPEATALESLHYDISAEEYREKKRRICLNSFLNRTPWTEFRHQVQRELIPAFDHRTRQAFLLGFELQAKIWSPTTPSWQFESELQMDFVSQEDGHDGWPAVTEQLLNLLSLDYQPVATNVRQLDQIGVEDSPNGWRRALEILRSDLTKNSHVGRGVLNRHGLDRAISGANGNDGLPDVPADTSYCGNKELAERLGVPRRYHNAFCKKLDRMRSGKALDPQDWTALSNAKPNQKKFVYSPSSKKILDIAQEYKTKSGN